MILFVEAEVVESALIKGQASQDGLRKLIFTFWRFATEFGLDIYTCRVSTDASIADTISRHDLQVAVRCGWPRRRVAWRGVLAGGPGLVLA